MLTKSAKNMYDLTRPYKELQEKCQTFRPKNRTKIDFSTKKPFRKNQEVPRMLPRNPGKPKNKREEAGDLKIPGYNLTHRQETRTTKVQEGNVKLLEIRFISIEKSIR